MAGLAEQWFRIADEDKDGKIGGAEAVRFFMRSGLPKDVLGQVRELGCCAFEGSWATLKPLQSPEDAFDRRCDDDKGSQNDGVPVFGALEAAVVAQRQERLRARGRCCCCCRCCCCYCCRCCSRLLLLCTTHFRPAMPHHTPLPPPMQHRSGSSRRAARPRSRSRSSTPRCASSRSRR